MKIKYWLLFGFVFVINACSEQQGRRPKSPVSSEKINEAIELHSQLVSRENARIQKFIKNDSLQKYQNSQKGFWYRYLHKKEGGRLVKKGDKVTFEQTIFSLNGALLYAAEELGIQNYVVDQEYVMKGVREGIKLMKEGEEMLFVLPSFMAYRSTGDKNGRIGSNEPIVMKIKLTKIIN